MYPGLKIVDVGFAALGSAGKASFLGGARFAELPVREIGGEGRALGGADCSQFGVGAGLARAAEVAPPIRAAIAEADLLLEVDRGGNMGPAAAVPHPAFLPTAERLDCWVEDLSLRTLFTPTEWPRIDAAVVGPPELEEEPAPAAGPGREG